KPARALAQRGEAADEGDRPLPRRDELPLTLLGGARPRHRRRQPRPPRRPRPPTDRTHRGRTPSQPQRRGGGRRLESSPEPTPKRSYSVSGTLKDPGKVGGSDAGRCPGGRRCSCDAKTEEVLRRAA